MFAKRVVYYSSVYRIFFICIFVKENYGRNEKLKVEKVKNLFNHLNLKQEFEHFEEEQFNLITNRIMSIEFEENAVSPIQTELIKSILNLYSKKIFKRNK